MNSAEMEANVIMGVKFTSLSKRIKKEIDCKRKGKSLSRGPDKIQIALDYSYLSGTTLRATHVIMHSRSRRIHM